MSRHFERYADSAAEQNAMHATLGAGPDDEAMEDAAEALRQVEVEAVQPESPASPELSDASSLNPTQLESMSIDELRVLARELDVPDRSTITEQDELIAAIRRRL